MPIIGVTGSQNTKGFLNPLAPTIGTATNVGTSRAYNNGAATVAFTANPAGAPATSFTATSSPGGYTATGASSPLTVTGLQSNTAYTFVVKATNAVGDSPNSSASNSITATTVPQAPTVGSISSNTGAVGRMNVPFTAGANGGSTATGFTATSSPGSITGTGSSSPIVVSGLTPGTSYTFTVTATNANGTSAASSASNSAAASQYSCTPHGGSLSGSTCTFNATSNFFYTCNATCSSGTVIGCYTDYGQVVSNGQGCDFFGPGGGNVICWSTNSGPTCWGGGCQNTCTLNQSYSCPGGTSQQGSSCSYAAAIV
jgi:hypothetical protein